MSENISSKMWEDKCKELEEKLHKEKIKNQIKTQLLIKLIVDNSKMVIDENQKFIDKLWKEYWGEYE